MERIYSQEVFPMLIKGYEVFYKPKGEENLTAIDTKTSSFKAVLELVKSPDISFFLSSNS